MPVSSLLYGNLIILIQPPRPIYVDPAERVAATSDKSNFDPVETWTVSLLDKKGKKKKGTLGVGKGSIYFASESDKVSHLCSMWLYNILMNSVDPSSAMEICRHGLSFLGQEKHPT